MPEVVTWSLASIVAVPRLFVIAPFTTSLRLTAKFSTGSAVVSSTTVTASDFDFSTGANVSVPRRAV